MKIPQRLRIVGLDWKVVMDHQWCQDRQVHGATEAQFQVIHLDPSAAPGLLEQTFLHELLHATWWSMGLKEYYGNKDEERIVNSLANGLYQAMNDNGLLSKR